MHLFSETFLAVFIFTALILTGLGAAVLIGLILRDWKNNRLW